MEDLPQKSGDPATTVSAVKKKPPALPVASFYQMFFLIRRMFFPSLYSYVISSMLFLTM